MTATVDGNAAPFGEWCIVEMLGHRRLAGYLREVQIAGQGFLRLDIPDADDDPGRTQYIAPASIYALHPVAEATARAASKAWRPEPISRWELKEITPVMAAFPNPPFEDPDDGFDDDEEDGDLAPALESVTPSEAYL